MVTTLDFGADEQQKPMSAYFARTLLMQDVDQVLSIELALTVDDGAVLYWNGQEIARVNMPAGEVDSATGALQAVGGSDETDPKPVAFSAALLREGINFLAAEVHQAKPTSSDLRFDAQIKLKRRAGGS